MNVPAVSTPVGALAAPLLVGLLLGTGALAHPGSNTTARTLDEETLRRYALAVEALQQGDPSAARREFADGAARGTVITPYTDYLLAEALLRGGGPREGLKVAESVADRYPDSPVAKAALQLAAWAADRAGDPTRAEAILRRLTARYAAAPDIAATLYLLGMTFEARGQRGHAAQTYRELTLLKPASEYAEGAADRLSALARAGTTLPPVSPSQRLARAERLLEAGALDPARSEALALANDTGVPETVTRALEVAAEALQRSRRYDAAASVLERALAQAPAARVPRIRLELGRALFRAGQDPEAQAALAEVGSTSPPEAAEASYLRGQVFEDAGLDGEALALYEQTAARYPDRSVAAGALWRAGWLAYLQGELSQASELWTRLAKSPVGQRYRLPVTYWTARVLEALGRPAEAAPLYEAVLREAPRGYYGLLARRRVQPMPSPGAPPPPPLELPDPESGLAEDLDWTRIETLRRLGLAEFADAEMEALVQRSIANPQALYTLASAYARAARHDLALRIARRAFGDIASSGHPALPRGFWVLMYPLGFEHAILDAATRAGVDPFLASAVAREESNFSPVARSRAGARGLMQLMPQTAKQIAARLGLPAREADLLDEPSINVTFGTAMLSSLLQEFADPRLAIAAYNAGPHKVRQWWGRRRTDDLEAWVEQIPYEETRLYVKRVLVSWAEYRRLYGAE